MPYDGRVVVLPRPRVRTADGKQEVDAPMVELFLSVDPIADRRRARGVSAEQALAAVREARSPRAVESEEQEAFVRSYPV